jgi:hypothetical protein
MVVSRGNGCIQKAVILQNLGRDLPDLDSDVQSIDLLSQGAKRRLFRCVCVCEEPLDAGDIAAQTPRELMGGRLLVLT